MKTRVIQPRLGMEKEAHIIKKYDMNTLKKVLATYKFRDLAALFKDKEENLSDSPTDDDIDEDDSSGENINQPSEVMSHETLQSKVHEQDIALQKMFALTAKLETEHLAQSRRTEILECYYSVDKMMDDEDVDQPNRRNERATHGEGDSHNNPGQFSPGKKEDNGPSCSAQEDEAQPEEAAVEADINAWAIVPFDWATQS